MSNSTTIKTYDLAAEWYAENHWNMGKRFERYYGEVLKILKKGSLILDAGCGPGRDVLYFLNKGYRVIGVDASEGMIREAKKRAPEGTFLKMDIEKLRFEKNTFDCVWACASVLHVRKSGIAKVLKGFKKVLKREGILFITVKKGIGEKIKIYPNGTKRFFAYYAKGELEGLLRNAGFRKIRGYLDKDENGDVWINYLGRKEK